MFAKIDTGEIRDDGRGREAHRAAKAVGGVEKDD
jgi:hypothetical protein